MIHYIYRHGVTWQKPLANFLFISDCKGSALETRSQISKEEGFYLFPLAKTGQIPEQLKQLVKTPPSPPDEIILSERKELPVH